MKTIRLTICILSALILLASSTSFAAEPIPGDSCAGFPEGAFMRSGGPENAGYVYSLSCQSGFWSEAVINPDTTPDAFSFTDQADVSTSTLISSNTLNITGIDASVAVSISGDGSPQFSINGGAWGTSGTITNGQTLQLRLTSNSSVATMNSATVTVGTATDQFDVSTLDCNNTVLSFPYTGSPSVFSIATGMENCTYTIALKGGGGASSRMGNGTGGNGGLVSYQLSPGSTGNLNMQIGGGGQPSNGGGPYGGGGGGGDRAGQGGGLTKVSFGATLLAVAGGGGGGGGRSSGGTSGNGGHGGAATGGLGGTSSTGHGGGGGGTQSAGGAGGTGGTTGQSGSSLQGGGGTGDCCFGGGGGGGGYYGGGGGSGRNSGTQSSTGAGGGGGGGSNYVNTGFSGYLTASSTQGGGSSGGPTEDDAGVDGVVTITITP
jgi:hypothetical protein